MSLLATDKRPSADGFWPSCLLLCKNVCCLTISKPCLRDCRAYPTISPSCTPSAYLSFHCPYTLQILHEACYTPLKQHCNVFTCCVVPRNHPILWFWPSANYPHLLALIPHYLCITLFSCSSYHLTGAHESLPPHHDSIYSILI